MGCTQAFVSDPKQSKKLRVATLNFSGIALSPFEFYTTSLQQEQVGLNKIFKSILYKRKNIDKSKQKQKSKEKQMKTFYSSLMKKIDKLFKQKRYSPLYKMDCGVINGKFINQKQFNILWEQEWKSNALKVESTDESLKNAKQSDKEEALKNLKEFDFICYQTILEYVYELDFQNVLKSKSVKQFFEFMEMCFNKPSLDIEKKADLLIQFLDKHNIDLMFLQEATEKLFQIIEKSTPDYRIIRGRKTQDKSLINGNSAILIRQKKLMKSTFAKKSNLIFKKLIDDTSIPEQDKKNFLIWNDSAIISVDNFIFVSVHSKGLTEQILKDIYLVRKKFPKKYLVIGGVLKKYETAIAEFDKQPSHQKYVKLIQEDFHRYPYNSPFVGENEKDYKPEIITNYKKRTWMQTQYDKANKQTKECTSYIFFDKRLQYLTEGSRFKQGVIQTSTPIDFQVNDNQDLLPNQKHPFDDFIVITTIKIPKKITTDDKLQKGEMNQFLIDDQQRELFGTSSSEQQDGNQERKSEQEEQQELLH